MRIAYGDSQFLHYLDGLTGAHLVVSSGRELVQRGRPSELTRRSGAPVSIVANQKDLLAFPTGTRLHFVGVRLSECLAELRVTSVRRSALPFDPNSFLFPEREEVLIGSGVLLFREGHILDVSGEKLDEIGQLIWEIIANEQDPASLVSPSTEDLAPLQNLKNTFYGVRHGRSWPNERGIIVSNPIDGVLPQHRLSFQGRDEAEAQLERWVASNTHILAAAEEDNVLIFCSDFSRAHETAEILAKVLGISADQIQDRIITRGELRERFFGGQLEGGDHRGYQRVWNLDAQDASHTTFRNESVEHVSARITKLVRWIEERFSGKTVFFVGHGDPIKIALTTFRGLPLCTHHQFEPIYNAQVVALNPST